MLAVLQARMSSSRLPGKVLEPILGRPMLARQIERIRDSREISTLVVATSDNPSDDVIETLCGEIRVPCFRGSLNDVLDRFYRAARAYKPDAVVRLTGDCPLIDPGVIDRTIGFYRRGAFDYVSNTLQPTFPDGLDIEICRFAALERAWREASLKSQREHVTLFLYQHPELFRTGSYCESPDHSHLCWTVDEPADLGFVRTIYAALYPDNPQFRMMDVLAFLQGRPELAQPSATRRRNEGLAKSLREDASVAKLKRMPTEIVSKPLVGENAGRLAGRYRRSEEMLARALKVIPLGTQTFSKSRIQYPFGVSPFYASKAAGSRIVDVDGNEYIDFVNGLCAVTLGYNDPDVTAAVRAQLEDGVIFSLPHPRETEVAEQIAEIVPCAEMTRFGKNGSDATAGAIRVARAYTGREHVAVCGYHGWQDWYIGSTARHAGVPESTRALTHPFTYNRLDSLERIFGEFPGQVAAVIMEPMNVTEPEPGFLENVRDLAHRRGALLIFDETITGFRYANGGAQELFGVTPDLATFGKGLANGYPLSAVTGRADVMRLMEEVFFSFTFGGETLSLAASQAVLRKLRREPVTRTLRERGTELASGLRELIARHRANDLLDVAGHPSWTFLLIRENPAYPQLHLKTLLLQEIFARGILTIGTHNMSYAHSAADVRCLLDAYDEVIPILRDVVENRTLPQRLRCEPLAPLFKVR